MAGNSRVSALALVYSVSTLVLVIPAAQINPETTGIALAAVSMSSGFGYLIVRFALDQVFKKQETEPCEPKVGTYTGLIERTAVTLFVISGLSAGIAVIVAIKALGRIKDLREDQGDLAERFMVGSLTSLSWAAAVGVVASLIITRL